MRFLMKPYFFIKRLWTNKSGQGMVEYGLILALVAVVIIATLALIGDRLLEVFQEILAELTNRTDGTPSG